MSSYEPSLPEAELRDGADATRPASRRWLLDKRVPLAMIGSLTVQILVAGLWFGRTETRLDMLDAWVRQNQATDRRLAVIESRLDGVHESLDRIEHRLVGGE
jgi:hypothetical protein